MPPLSADVHSPDDVIAPQVTQLLAAGKMLAFLELPLNQEPPPAKNLLEDTNELLCPPWRNSSVTAIRQRPRGA